MRRSVPSLAETALEAEAFWATGPGPDELRRETLRSPRGNEVLVRTLYPRISRRTEVIVFQGAVQPSEYRRMRAPVQTGEFPAPLKCAYTSVGRVEQGPATLRGRDVFCPHPHQSRYLVPDDAVHPLPDGIPPERAVLAANPEPDTVSAEAALPVPPDNSTAFSRIMDAPLLRQRKPAAGRRVGAGRARWHIAAARSGAELERVLSL